MSVWFVVPEDERASRNLAYAVSSVAGAGPRAINLAQQRLDRDARRALQDFEHTPQPLIESWIAFRKLLAATDPGDTILISDKRGLGGVFALDQRSQPVAQRRTLITVASDSAYLHWRMVAGTVDGLPMPLAAEIDWEVTQYRNSDRVVTMAEMAAAYLHELGVEPEILAPESSESKVPGEFGTIWAPEPVGRRSRTGDIIRAVASMDAALVVSEADEPDEVWSGSGWDALRHARAVIGGRVTRSDQPTTDSVLVLGDPFSVPSMAIVARVTDGLPVVVPAASAASAHWPHAPTWSDADDLVAALGGNQSPRMPLAPAPLTPRSPVPSRARRISVGIPVFRDVRFLDECLHSLLAQDLEPYEIILVDDGSQSDDVDAALDRAHAMDSRIEILRAGHRGVCVARNRALEEMSGDSFLFVDSDDVLEPEFLQRCAEALRSDARLWAAAAWTRFFGAYEGIEAKPPFDSRVGFRENPIISTAALVDMRVRDAGIWFAPDLAFLYCEDWHFWSQIVAAGGAFGLVPAPLIRHRVHQASGGFMRTDLAHAIGKSRATQPLRE